MSFKIKRSGVVTSDQNVKGDPEIINKIADQLNHELEEQMNMNRPNRESFCKMNKSMILAPE